MLTGGARLGNFEIVAPLRSGGMAALYLARRRGAAGFDRPVAIKVIHPHFADDQAFVSMFLDEARLAAKIDDPHVIHIEELGEENGQYFIVMELVQGRSLAELLRALAKQGRRMHPTCAVHVALHVARGLGAAHEAVGGDGRPLGVVHRDVSPQNILLSFRGHVKLIDFGIAKARGQSHVTVGDSLRGKIAYMSPEQAFGREVDARTDVYALGIVLWEMLGNRRLFTAETDMALLEKVRRPAVTPPSAIVPSLSPELDQVVLDALAPDAADRIASAREFGRRLGAVPEARPLEPSDLAALLAAVAPDDPNAPWNIRSGDAPASEDELPTDRTQAALDTLSVVSEDVSPPGAASGETGTGATVLALEAARGAAVRWRRRAFGVGVTGITAAVLVVLAARRGPPPMPGGPPPAMSPFEASAALIEPPPAAPSTPPPALSPSPLPLPLPSLRAKPPAHVRTRTDAGRSAGKRSVEIINGVPMARDDP